ncbi:TMEM175 family protein [Nocardia sp. CDC153]|uniref:TMEM175 family protein n=1 Tax=Nocardia sp. CDC153 TaxID=3112167 RepID=UPI002DB64E39|nr:TMEM175 family protein [Nocardia sp. CDC153]MEC3952550.1 TMEM175 family protein [Nocardia sp. CDC153]
MSEGSVPNGTLTGTARVEAFSDGVMAIAITLLILNIQVPPHEPGHLLQELGHIWPTYLAYLASFMTIGVVWMNHHTFFGRLRRIDHVLRWWNLMLLLGVSLVPFPTIVVADNVVHGTRRDAVVAVALYGIVGVIMTIPWAPMWRRLEQRPEMLKPGLGVDYARRERWRAWPGILVYAVTIGIGFLSPITALVLYLLVSTFYGVSNKGWSSPSDPDPDEA